MKSDNKSHEVKKSNISIKSNNFERENEAKVLVLETAGYPFSFGMLESPNIEISDKYLFEQYAKEQWVGSVVEIGSYLFDQKILPDYAFRVVAVYPNNSIITENTAIVTTAVEDEKKEQAKSVISDIHMDDVIGQVNAKKKNILKTLTALVHGLQRMFCSMVFQELEKPCLQRLCPMSWMSSSF